MPSDLIRLLIAEDDELIRAGLCEYFASTPDIRLVSAVENGACALDILKAQEVDVLLTDMQMPVMGGQELILKAQRLPHPPVVIVLTGITEHTLMVGALRAGAKGFLLKTESPETIQAAVRTAASGGQVVSCDSLAQLLDQVPVVPRCEAPGPAITQREANILDCLMEGLSNREIAQRLIISEATVKKHLLSLYNKYGVDTRLRLVVLASTLARKVKSED